MEADIERIEQHFLKATEHFARLAEEYEAAHWAKVREHIARGDGWKVVSGPGGMHVVPVPRQE